MGYILRGIFGEGKGKKMGGTRTGQKETKWNTAREEGGGKSEFLRRGSTCISRQKKRGRYIQSSNRTKREGAKQGKVFGWA